MDFCWDKSCHVCSKHVCLLTPFWEHREIISNRIIFLVGVKDVALSSSGHERCLTVGLTMGDFPSQSCPGNVKQNDTNSTNTTTLASETNDRASQQISNSGIQSNCLWSCGSQQTTVLNLLNVQQQTYGSWQPEVIPDHVFKRWKLQSLGVMDNTYSDIFRSLFYLSPSLCPGLTSPLSDSGAAMLSILPHPHHRPRRRAQGQPLNLWAKRKRTPLLNAIGIWES